MPTFSYQVVSQQGKQNKGNLDAETRDAAMAALRAAGGTVISVDEVGALNLEDIETFIGDKIPVQWAEDDLFVTDFVQPARSRQIGRGRADGRGKPDGRGKSDGRGKADGRSKSGGSTRPPRRRRTSQA